MAQRNQPQPSEEGSRPLAPGGRSSDERKPRGSVDLRMYYLWRHTRGRTEWRDYSVIGAIATVNF